jgi:hypothetical protein
MDVLYEFQPFVFSSTSSAGVYVEGLPLKSPIGDLLDSHGRICGLFQLRFPAVIGLERTAKEILPFFVSTFYGRECTSVHNHLLECLQETQTYLEKSIMDFSSIEGIDYSLCIGVLWGSVLYVARFGGSVGLRIYRKDTFGNLFVVDQTSGSHSIVSASGYVEHNDVIAFYNDQTDGASFPLSTASLIGLDEQHSYARLTGYFGTQVLQKPSSCVCGVYIKPTLVPSIEDEQIIFKDLDVEERTTLVNEDTSDIDEKVIKDNLIDRQNQAKMFETPAALKNFRAKIFSRLHSPEIFKNRFGFLKFFTHSRIFFISCSMLILFVGLVVSGKDYEKVVKNEKALELQKTELLPQIDTAYKQGLYYAELNPTRAKEYLIDAKKLLSNFSNPDADISKLVAEVDSAYATVTKTYLLDSISPYFDLSAVNAEAQGSRISLYDSVLVVSDKKNNVVYQIGSESRSAKAIIGSTDVIGLIGADGFDGTVYSVSSQGIARYEDKSSKVTRLLDGQTSWGEIVDIQLFGGNVYLLDQTNNQIWKYIPEESGFAAPRNYISSDSVVGLQDATSFSIDGNVWVGTSQGEVIKFYSGKRDPFSLSGIDGGLLSIDSVFTDADSDFLYLLDSKLGRVVVVNKKDGNYVSSYQSKSFVGATDIALNVKSKYLYVLNNQKIFRTEIREAVLTEETP